MEILPDAFSIWLTQYGSIALFFLLALGIVCLPVPEDTLMMFAGLLMYNGDLPIGWGYLSACLGSICGISVSYFIGHKAGDFLIKKYGKYLGLTDERMIRVHWWFERFGGWFLIIGYFIPGIRHFTGLFAGISAMEFRHFAFYAYPGAIIWVTLLLSIGYFFGTCCEQMIEIVEHNIEIFLVVAAIIICGYLVFKFRKK
jgi:membrane protein DedA with SNARE-associated domain